MVTVSIDTNFNYMNNNNKPKPIRGAYVNFGGMTAQSDFYFFYSNPAPSSTEAQSRLRISENLTAAAMA